MIWLIAGCKLPCSQSWVETRAVADVGIMRHVNNLKHAYIIDEVESLASFGNPIEPPSLGRISGAFLGHALASVSVLAYITVIWSPIAWTDCCSLDLR